MPSTEREDIVTKLRRLENELADANTRRDAVAWMVATAHAMVQAAREIERLRARESLTLR